MKQRVRTRVEKIRRHAGAAPQPTPQRTEYSVIDDPKAERGAPRW